MTVPSANTAAIAHLRRRGFVALRQTLRMVRGSPLVWHPSGIWSVINFHLG
ncbi:MAG: hypothetical protein M1296_05920 [Chloroflexi bacterium]|nr:hypothetical protein [Chloroflexota bacterium]